MASRRWDTRKLGVSEVYHERLLRPSHFDQNGAAQVGWGWRSPLRITTNAVLFEICLFPSVQHVGTCVTRKARRETTLGGNVGNDDPIQSAEAKSRTYTGGEVDLGWIDPLTVRTRPEKGAGFQV